MWGDRSGREPVHARSALRLRRALGIFGGVWCAVGLGYLGWRGGDPVWATVLLAAALVASVVDIAVLQRRLGHQDDRGV